MSKIFLILGATDRSKIRSNQHRIFFDEGLYPISFFANTPFKSIKTLQGKNEIRIELNFRF